LKKYDFSRAQFPKTSFIGPIGSQSLRQLYEGAYMSTPRELSICQLNPSWEHISRECHLTPRELQVLRLAFNAEKDVAIGKCLGISPHTVNWYLRKIFEKLGVNCRMQLIARIMQFDLARDARPRDHLDPAEVRT